MPDGAMFRVPPKGSAVMVMFAAIAPGNIRIRSMNTAKRILYFMIDHFPMILTSPMITASNARDMMRPDCSRSCTHRLAS